MKNADCPAPSPSFKKLKSFAVAALLASAMLPGSSQAAILSWSGGGGNAYWNNSANWGFVGVPANGDTLIFSTPQPLLTNTNDIPNLVLNQIRFIGAAGGYVIRGNGFTLTNSIQATNTLGTNVIENNIVLANVDQVANVTAGLNLLGVLSGSVGLVKNGPGVLTIAGPQSNIYGGITTVNAGVVLLNKIGSPIAATAIPGDLIIGDGVSTAVVRNLTVLEIADTSKLTINGHGTWDLNGNSETVNSPLTMNDTGTVTLGGGTLTLPAPSSIVSQGLGTNRIAAPGNLQLSAGPSTITTVNNSILIISANILGSAAVTKAGLGKLVLDGVNAYTGLTVVSEGYLWAENSLALGTAASGTVVSNLATLVVNGGITITNEALTLNGPGRPAWAALDTEAFETNTWGGPIVLNADSTLGNYGSGTLRLTGALSGAGGWQLIAGGTVSLEGSAPNTYSGTTYVSAASATLVLNRTAGDQTVPHDLIIDGTVLYRSFNQVANSANVVVNGTLNLNDFYEGLGTISGSGNILLGTGFLDMYGSANYTFSGVISGSGAQGFSQYGSGTATLNGTNTYTGTTLVSSGKLVINGLQPQSAVTVGTFGTLGGSGTVGTLAANGLITPGTSPGVLTTSNATFSSTGKFTVELTGSRPGTNGYDQLNVRGTTTLGNATLTVVPAFTSAAAVGQNFYIINNDSTDPVVGTFNGLAEGASISTNGFAFTISYAGGSSGNDVVLTVTNVPGVATGYSVSSGNGSGAIDPNECNLIYVGFSNKTGVAMTGVSATLVSLTPNVAVVQPFSTYPTVPGNGNATNSTPFQLTTSSNFVCGTPITLQLNISSVSQPAFGFPVTLSSGSPSAVPSRYDVSTVTNIPDIGTIESTNTVAGFVGSVGKVAVSLWLTHALDADLSLSLVAPDNTVIPLVSGVGAGANFGTACSPDSSRTTFDDSAAASITAGSPPFAGTYRPMSPLSSINRTNSNGQWRLRVTDSFGGSLGSLRCWSLLLYPTLCSSGSGMCELCPNVTIRGATGIGSALQQNYVALGAPSVCGIAKPCPGTQPTGGSYPADVYTFRNGPSDACITVTVENNATNGSILAAAYLGVVDLANTNRCLNYLADAGLPVSIANPSQTFSFTVGSNAVFSLDLITDYTVALPYTLTVTGGDCRPALNIAPAGGGNVQLDWSTAAGGYALESTNKLVTGATAWPGVTNVPIVVNSHFRVTNNAAAAGQFYRLHKQ